VQEHIDQRLPARGDLQLGQRPFQHQPALVEQPEAVAQVLGFV
jgi:hypothetical protein